MVFITPDNFNNEPTDNAIYAFSLGFILSLESISK